MTDRIAFEADYRDPNRDPPGKAAGRGRSSGWKIRRHQVVGPPGFPFGVKSPAIAKGKRFFQYFPRGNLATVNLLDPKRAPIPS
jgi:hypothetical protein